MLFKTSREPVQHTTTGARRAAYAAFRMVGIAPGRESAGMRATPSLHATAVHGVPCRRPVAQVLVDTLLSAGVDTFFGVPGGPIISMFHRVLLAEDTTLVESRQESGAAFAAMGFHRATGHTPAVLVTAGPGITNVVTGVAAASAEAIPMIVVCGDVASDGRRLAQDLNARRRGGIDTLFQGIARCVRRVERPDGADAVLRDVLAAATNPADPGPAVLVLPVDRADAPCHAATLVRSPVRPAPARLPEAAIAQILAWLRSAARPILVVGAGCRGQVGAVRELVDTLGIPVMTTPQAKGLVSEKHPASLRSGGMSASHWARRYCAEGPDVALVLGTDLDDSAVAGTPVVAAGGIVVHVDRDPTVLGRNLPTALGLVADVGDAARALTLAARADDGAWPVDTDRLVAPARERSPFDEPAFATDDSGTIAPHRVIADLERAAGPDARFVSDIGEHMLFALHYLTCTRPDHLTLHLGLGSMGSGIGSAIGLALGAPGRVVCVCGDGGMQMNGAEVLVAARLGLPIVYAVFNDARYNMVFHGYRLTHEREEPWDTPHVDFVQWATAQGLTGRRIERPGEITAALLDELTAQGPCVLDIRQDRDRRIRGDGRIEALRQMSFGEGSA